jgi:hypothetical protein
MNDRVFVGGLVHEVTGEHFRSYGAVGEKTEVKLDLVCGGYVTVPRDFDWRTVEVPTCLHCVAGSSQNRIDSVTLDAHYVDTQILADLEKKFRP